MMARDHYDPRSGDIAIGSNGKYIRVLSDLLTASQGRAADLARQVEASQNALRAYETAYVRIKDGSGVIMAPEHVAALDSAHRLAQSAFAPTPSAA